MERITVDNLIDFTKAICKTSEDVIPSMSVPIGGNMISARSLDLDRDFSEIAYTLDMIAKGCFGVELNKIA